MKRQGLERAQPTFRRAGNANQNKFSAHWQACKNDAIAALEEIRSIGRTNNVKKDAVMSKDWREFNRVLDY